ncbi:three-prime repair exonuclease 1-like [Ptychodera flava]|uniref:three-prime repair exonuclease 1-like n=1 Tax=Ptychodera flava TaxID=63121 RepID=UPI003969FEF8
MSLKRKDGSDNESETEETRKVPRMAELSLPSLQLERTGAVSSIQTFVFIDFEATGLPDSAGNWPDITELAMVAVSRRAILGNTNNGDVPRIRDKLTLCLRPDKDLSSNAERMSGLTKSMLTDHAKKPMNSDVDGALRYFLRRQEAPVCLVSHAGDRMDFPLLRNELEKVSGTWDRLYTADSLMFFQDNLPRQQGKTLQGLCQRYLHFEPNHDAESDAVGLLRLLTLPTFSQKFLDWVQRKKKQF